MCPGAEQEFGIAVLGSLDVDGVSGPRLQYEKTQLVMTERTEVSVVFDRRSSTVHGTLFISASSSACCTRG